MSEPASPGARRARPVAVVMFVLGLAIATCFAVLGSWQLERRAWKNDLIARVDARLAAPPVAAPGPATWARIDRQGHEYLKVTATGRFLHDRETLVQAVTDYGPGYWVMTPMRTDRSTLLINRGFVPGDRRDPVRRRAGQVGGPVTVHGLLRLSEPGGGFLRTNDARADRWYSRDVAAIAAARGLGRVAPYFVDADAAANPGGHPRGGLTQLRFRDQHLQYALTWFVLAVLSVVGLVILVRHERGRR